jgi:hypothetical protein
MVRDEQCETVLRRLRIQPRDVLTQPLGKLSYAREHVQALNRFLQGYLIIDFNRCPHGDDGKESLTVSGIQRCKSCTTGGCLHVQIPVCKRTDPPYFGMFQKEHTITSGLGLVTGYEYLQFISNGIVTITLHYKQRKH